VTYDNLNRALGVRGLKAISFCVLAETVAHGPRDAEGAQCYAARATIAGHLRISEPAVRAAYAALVEAGHLMLRGVGAFGTKIYVPTLPHAHPREANKLMARAAYLHDLPPLPRAIFVAIAATADYGGLTRGRCPTVTELRQRFLASDRAVRGAISMLTGLRLLVQRRRPARGRPVLFDVNITPAVADYVRGERDRRRASAGLDGKLPAQHGRQDSEQPPPAAGSEMVYLQNDTDAEHRQVSETTPAESFPDTLYQDNHVSFGAPAGQTAGALQNQHVSGIAAQRQDRSLGLRFAKHFQDPENLEDGDILVELAMAADLQLAALYDSATCPEAAEAIEHQRRHLVTPEIERALLRRNLDFLLYAENPTRRPSPWMLRLRPEELRELAQRHLDSLRRITDPPDAVKICMARLQIMAADPSLAS
jgi:hypothetical protein